MPKISRRAMLAELGPLLTAPEREALLRELDRITYWRLGEAERLTRILYAFAKAARRGERKRELNAASDGRRRILVGARVPREFYERCRQEADAWGLSLYAWVVRALERALEHPLE